MSPLSIYKQMGSIARLAVKAYGPYKRQILGLTVLGFVSGILEGIGINAVIPLLSLVLGMHGVATDMLSVAIQNFFAFLHIPFLPRYLLAFIVLLFIAKAAVSLWLGYITLKISAEYDRATRSKLFTSVIRASWPYILRQKLGNLETLLLVDTSASSSLLQKITFTITLGTSLIMYLVVAYSISPLVTLSTLVLGLLIFVFLRPLMDRVHAGSQQRAVTYRDTLHHVNEHVGGLKTVKALGAQDSAVERADMHFGRIKELTVRISVIQQLATQAVAPIGIIYIAAILSLAFKTPFISFAALPPILYLIYRIFTYVQQLQNNVQYMSELAPHLERVVAHRVSANESYEEDTGTAAFKFDHSLRFESVSFRYDTGREVLKKLSFEIEKGKMVGLVGPSGAGKTTCVDLILRLLQPVSGAITLDGIAIKDISLSAWRANVGYVSQDFFLIQDTIRNNIRFYDDSITDEDVWEAARMAHIDEFIRKSPQGLDTMVGERGVRLSAGERQRITIARALARKPQILILDEATSSLDNESEAHIRRVVEELKGKITIIAIAHRLSTIMDSDELIVIQEGEVVETGTPQKLLENTGSYFYKVYTINQ